MKPIDRRKFFIALHRGCKARGLILVEDPDAGGGSHGSLNFDSVSGGKSLRLVIAYAREISPGVQRGMLRYVSQQIDVRTAAADSSLARSVFELLGECLH